MRTNLRQIFLGSSLYLQPVDDNCIGRSHLLSAGNESSFDGEAVFNPVANGKTDLPHCGSSGVHVEKLETQDR